MHIGIYINNENISSVDCKNLLVGNPGIGGTEYCVLLLAQAYKMYYSTLNPGHSMNYHSHKNRDEVWVVISGEGKTIVDGMEQMVKPGDVITMSAGCRHTVIADTELKLIEVQLGADINVHDKQKFELEQ